jgi:hypothetical protein
MERVEHNIQSATRCQIVWRNDDMNHTPCKKPTILLLALLLLVPLASLRAGAQGFGPVGGSSHEVVLEAVELPDGLYAYRMKSHRIDGRDVTSTGTGSV